MKQLIFVIFLLAGIHFVGASQDVKTKVDGSDYKKKVESNGDMKIKYGHKKIKIDGKTGKRTVKYD